MIPKRTQKQYNLMYGIHDYSTMKRVFKKKKKNSSCSTIWCAPLYSALQRHRTNSRIQDAQDEVH